MVVLITKINKNLDTIDDHDKCHKALNVLSILLGKLAAGNYQARRGIDTIIIDDTVAWTSDELFALSQDTAFGNLTTAHQGSVEFIRNMVFVIVPESFLTIVQSDKAAIFTAIRSMAF
jgi:hypothetical protein